MDLPVNRVVSQLIVHDAVVWDPGMVLVDMALAGTGTGLGIDPHRVKTLPSRLFEAPVFWKKMCLGWVFQVRLVVMVRYIARANKHLET